MQIQLLDGAPQLEAPTEIGCQSVDLAITLRTPGGVLQRARVRVAVQDRPPGPVSTDGQGVFTVRLSQLANEQQVAVRVLACAANGWVDAILALPKASEKLGQHALELLPMAQLLLDAGRDGKLTAEDLERWEWGPKGRGAVVLCNDDDSDRSGRPDNADEVVNGQADLPHIAPLDVWWRCPFKPDDAGIRVSLTLGKADAERLRVFDGRRADSRELVGPGRGPSRPLDFRAVDRLELGMEAVRRHLTPEDGPLRVEVSVADDAGQGGARGSVRVAPWLLQHHLEQPETVFVAQYSLVGNEKFNNSDFIAALRPLMAECKVQLFDRFDRKIQWAQDVFELGKSSLPGARQACQSLLLRTGPDPIGQREQVRQALLGPGLGVISLDDERKDHNRNHYGNLEVTPPATTADGRVFPWGRIYHGLGADEATVHSLEFLRAQRVQEPFALDTSWLDKGHVDEILTFVPDRTREKGWKLLLASPDKAEALLHHALLVDPDARLLVGRRAGELGMGRYPDDIECAVADFLREPPFAAPLVDAGSKKEKVNAEETDDWFVIHFEKHTVRVTEWTEEAVEEAADAYQKLITPRLKSALLEELGHKPTFEEEQQAGTQAADEASEIWNGIYEAGGELLKERMGKKPPSASGSKKPAPSESGPAKPLHPFWQGNRAVQEKLDAVLVTLMEEVGVDPLQDVIHVPVLFRSPGKQGGGAEALTGNMVNMLVLAEHCVFARPYGPVVAKAGLDLFEDYLLGELHKLGQRGHPIDTWYPYHLSGGEVHCATNTRRVATPVDWWTFDPKGGSGKGKGSAAKPPPRATTLDDRIRQTFHIRGVPPDGNCLFESISRALAHRQVVRSAAQLRADAVAYLRANHGVRNRYAGVNADYLEEMAKVAENALQRGRWGGDPEIDALSRDRGRTIRVYAPTYPDPGYLDYNDQAGNTLNIYHVGGNHFVWLEPKQ